jgi:phytoene dehydrogenase-like protein
VTSAGDTLPGFVHDRCAAFFPLPAASPVFRDLGLERHRLRWITPTVAMAHPFADGSAIALHRDLDATVDSLHRASPGAGRALGHHVGWPLPRVAPAGSRAPWPSASSSAEDASTAASRSRRS